MKVVAVLGLNKIPPLARGLGFLCGEIGTVVDGEIMESMIVHYGSYQYETLGGAIPTVKKDRVLKSQEGE